MSDPILAEILKGQNELKGQFGRLAYDVATTRETVEKMSGRQDEQDADLAKHVVREEQLLKDIHAAQGELTKGFPLNPRTGERDPSFHAGWHEDDIDKSKVKKEFRQKLLIGAAAAILSVLCGVVTTLLVSGAKVELQRAANPAVEVKK